MPNINIHFARPVQTAKFVTVLQIDTEHQSYLFRDKQHISIILKSGEHIHGILIGKHMFENSILIHNKITHEIPLSDISELY